MTLFWEKKTVSEANRSVLYRQRLQQLLDALTVYPVSCEELSAGRSDRQWLEGVLGGGAKMVQLRDKKSKDNKLLEKAKYFRKKTREAGALFIVNDRVDIAIMADADGVHVGQGDLPPAEIKAIAPQMIIGLSCNSREDVIAVAKDGTLNTNPVSYYNIGPLYATQTKEGLSDFLGPDAVRSLSALCSLPFTVMGGIKSHHVGELVAAGVRRIAVVTALSQARDIQQETAKWMTLISESSNGKNN